MGNSIGGKKAFNNDKVEIFLGDDDLIPEGFKEGGLCHRSKEEYLESAKKGSKTLKEHIANDPNYKTHNAKMSRAEKDEFITTHRDDYISNYSKYGKEWCHNYYNISYTFMTELNKLWGVTKTNRDSSVWDKKKKEHLEELSYRVTKAELVSYYIEQNNSFEDTKIHFNICKNDLIRLLTLYDCKKPKELSNKISKETKYKKYGDENYNNREKSVQTCLFKYDVENVSQLESTLESMRKTWESHGFDHPMHVPEYRQKAIDSTIINGNFYNNDSIPNTKFATMLDENFINYEKEYTLDNYRYDFRVGDSLIEVNPFPFHNSTWAPIGEPKSKDYHFNKSKVARENGYRCLCIWDWDDINKIISLLIPRETVYARKTLVKEVSIKEAKEFINNTHLQGYAKDEIRLGLYLEDELISIMTFGKPRYNKNYEYELIRYCSSKNVIGGAEKLFKHFTNNFNATSIISYCDMSKFSGRTYEKLGFELKNISISRHWYNPKSKRHITDNLLRARGVDQLLGTNYGKGTSNNELMILEGFFEIYDSGQAVYEYINTSEV